MQLTMVHANADRNKITSTIRQYIIHNLFCNDRQLMNMFSNNRIVTSDMNKDTESLCVVTQEPFKGQWGTHSSQIFFILVSPGFDY